MVADVAEIVGVAMQKWAWLQNFRARSLICPASSVSYKVGNYVAMCTIYMCIIIM